MIVVALTGSIGMGKSTVAALCRRLHIPVDSADEAVHALLAPGGRGFAPVATAFPEALREGIIIDRVKLGALVFGHPDRLARLEAILHPLVAARRRQFLARAHARRCRLVVLDIPLLFEKRLEGLADTVITVSAPAYIQRARVLARPGMSEARFRAIRALQTPDAEKRRRSDHVILTGGSKAATARQLQLILRALDSRVTARKRNARNRPRYRNHRA